MTFYIPPFWCGVIATVLGEFISLVIYAVVKKSGIQLFAESEVAWLTIWCS